MKTVAAMKDDHKREAAVQAFMEGESSASVKTSIVRPVAKVEKVSPVDHLEAEKLKIEKAIESLQKKLQIVDKMIENEKNKIKE